VHFAFPDADKNHEYQGKKSPLLRSFAFWC
jgi:hypothetical protein